MPPAAFSSQSPSADTKSVHDHARAGAEAKGAPRFDPQLYQNPSGKVWDFDYGYFRSTFKGRDQQIVPYVANKLRLPPGASLDMPSPPGSEVVHRDLLLPSCTPPELRSIQDLWSAVDARMYHRGQDLALVVTLWFHHLPSFQAHREVCSFVQQHLVDRYQVAGLVVTHAPARRAGKGPVHVHALLTANVVTSEGLGQFCQPLCRANPVGTSHDQENGQLLVYRLWREYVATLPPAQRP